MADVASDKRMTVEEFFRWHERQEGKYELVDGRPVLKRGVGPKGMVGGTVRHARIGMNVGYALRSRLRSSGCQPLGPDIGVRTSDTQLRYPDVVVDCGTADQTNMDLDDPRVIVEVLSPSTSFIDQTYKLEEYKSVASIHHILLVEQRRPRVQLFTRTDEGSGFENFEGLEASIPLTALGIELLLIDVYEGIRFDDD